MLDRDDIPDSPVERAMMLEGVIIDFATGGGCQDAVYEELRREFMQNNEWKDLLPDFVRAHRSLKSIWSYIKERASTYAERRAIISEAFAPLFDRLEGANKLPLDAETSALLRTFDAEGVHDVWERALERRFSDPQGAITLARTLLEAVIKKILDEMNVSYSDTDDLPKIYGLAAKHLNLAPNSHSEVPIRSILGGANTVVNGLGTLRNRLSDAHAPSARLRAKPSPRHAALAVNMSGAMATFLVETWKAAPDRPGA